MMRCKLCGAPAHTRSSREISSETKERYNQCTNINCSHTFISLESYVRSISIPKTVTPIEAG